MIIRLLTVPSSDPAVSVPSLPAPSSVVRFGSGSGSSGGGGTDPAASSGADTSPWLYRAEDAGSWNTTNASKLTRYRIFSND